MNSRAFEPTNVKEVWRATPSPTRVHSRVQIRLCAMNACGLFSTAVLTLAVGFVGCGYGQGYNPDNVTVTVSPATATLSANGKIGLQATVNGLCSTCTPSISSWGIAEDAGSCDWFTNNGPPSGPCPAGTIEETGGDLGNSLSVTYHAPATPGTYHVVAQCCGAGLFGTLPPTKNGTSVITITP